MINSLITNSANECDNLCNALIIYSSALAKDLGITYGEFWIYLSLFVITLVIYYIIISYLCIYKKNKYIISIYWISNILLFLFTIFNTSLFFMFIKYL